VSSLPTADLVRSGEWVTVAGSAPGFRVAILLTDGRELDVCNILEGVFSFTFQPGEDARSVQVQVYGDRLPTLYTKSIPLPERDGAVSKQEIKPPGPEEKEVSPGIREQSATELTKRTAEKNLITLLPTEDLSRGRPDTGTVAITFDGGSYGNAATRILDVLEERGLKVTFFLTGEFMNRYPEITRRIANSGHEVGNHT
jgi:hypothetical protein